MIETQVNILSPEFLHNPYPAYAMLRQHHPLQFDTTLNMWLVTGYQVAMTLLKDRRLSSAHRTQPLPGVDISTITRMDETMMVFTDQPDHTRLRNLLHKSFTPAMMARMQAIISQITQELLMRMHMLDEVDFIRDFSYPLPIRVITAMLGVPAEDSDLFREWSQSYVAGVDLTATPAMQMRAEAVAQQFASYILAMAEQRRQQPQQDLLTLLVQAEDEGAKLTEMELVSNCFLLLIAGHETTTNLLANGLLALLQHPDQLAALQHNPALVPTAIEEMLRYDGPVGVLTRVVNENLEIEGHHLLAGQRVLIFPGAANRDPEVFAEPDRFEMTRTPNPHVAFGYGVHYCLGAPLARLESTIALQEFLKCYPQVQLAPQSLEYLMTLRIRALKHLLITL